MTNTSPPQVPAPVPTTPSLPSNTTAAPKQRDRGAYMLDQIIVPGALADLVGLNDINVLAAKDYLEKLLKDAGNPQDPVERILLEQLALAHFRLAGLHARAASATHVEQIRVFSAAAARLLGEIRRLALSIKTYREPPREKSFSVVHQQNVVTNGDQKVMQLVNDRPKETLAGRDELEDRSNHGVLRLSCKQEPAACGGRARERAETAAVDAGRARPVAPAVPRAAAVGEVHGAQDHGRQAPVGGERPA